MAIFNDIKKLKSEMFFYSFIATQAIIYIGSTYYNLKLVEK